MSLVFSSLFVLTFTCGTFYRRRSKRRILGSTFLHYSRRFRPMNRRRVRERRGKGCERKWLAKRMKDTEGEIKGIVASQTVWRLGRMWQCLACPHASSTTGVLLIYTACLQKLNTSTEVLIRSTHTVNCVHYRGRCSSSLYSILPLHACLYTQMSATVQLRILVDLFISTEINGR